MINKIKPNIFQLHFKNFSCCVYVLKINNKNILIDTGSKTARQELIEDLKQLNLAPEDITTIILTHNHYDHIENIEIFPKAKLYKSEELTENSIIPELPNVKIISTPGHAKESKCFLYQDILFSGDTIFHNGYVGRTDLPGSEPEKLRPSIEKLEKLNYKILCPGHLL